MGDATYASSPEFKALSIAHDGLLSATRAGRYHEAADQARRLSAQANPRWLPYYETLEARCRDLSRQLPDLATTEETAK
jgi:hypothetical protein